MEKVSVYDFDSAVYNGDCSLNFYFFCLRKNFKIIKYLPLILISKILLILNLTSLKKYQERVFKFLKNINNIDELIKNFWNKKIKKVYDYFTEEISENKNSYVISTIPEFILKGYFKDLKSVKVIGSEVNKKNGEVKNEVLNFEDNLKKLDSKIKIDKIVSNNRNIKKYITNPESAFLVEKGKLQNWNEEFLNKKRQNKIAFWLFMFFLTVYLILGIYFSFYHQGVYLLQTLFEADTWRVYEDMSNILAGHGRIKVHPLFVTITFPITYLLQSITASRVLAVIIVSAIISSISIVVLYKIISFFIKDEKIKILITLLFGFSFSYLTYTASIETYNFSAFFLLLLWYRVIKIVKTEKVEKVDYIYLTLLGIMNIGVTITNYIVFLIASFTLLISKKVKFKKLFILNVVVVLLAVGISFIQNFTWHNTPTLLEYSENYEEEKGYMNFELTSENPKNVIKGCFGNALISSPLTYLETIHVYIIFNNMPTLNIIALCLFYLLILYYLIRNGKKNLVLNVGIILTILFNFCLHIVYGNNNTFLYSCHTIYLPFLLLAINYQPTRKNRNYALLTFLIVFFTYELLCNAKAFKQMLVIITQKIHPHPYFLTRFHNPWLLIATVIIIFTLYLLVYLLGKSIKKAVVNNGDKRIIAIISGLIILAAISSIFVGISTIPTFEKVFNISVKK